MISVDTSSLVSFFKGDSGKDVDEIDAALEAKNLILSPVVLTEILSDTKLKESLKKTLSELPTLEIKDGFWERAGNNRAKILSKGLKARLGDILISQFCIDHNISLITRDSDFKKFHELIRLKIFYYSKNKN